MRHQKLMAGFAAFILSLFFAMTAWAGLSKTDIARIQKEIQSRGATFTVGPSSATERELSDLCGLVPPKDWWKDAPFKNLRAGESLPSYWNWCDKGICPPVRDQGTCGACWAFGTVGVLECNTLLRDGLESDLSEQYLLSCNTDGWDCIGGWWAHDYHEWKYSPPETEAGAVPESEFPYVAFTAPCAGPYTHPWKIDDWGYVGNSSSVPSVDAIKQAILDYGSVAVAIAIGPQFHAYSGGIFNIEEGVWDVNHAVVLVGWDDNQGTNGIWFLRNSWGDDWGENGYMRIEYGIDAVGYAANYVAYHLPDMAVEPLTDLDSSGYQWGPFSPESEIYRIQNHSESDLDYSVDKTADWITLDDGSTVGDGPLTGILAPGAYIDITVTIDEDANTLVPGTYEDTLTFTNLTSGSGNTDRSVTLEVLIPTPCECDLNHDGNCNILDWPYFIEDWGRTDCNDPGVVCECDLNGDGTCNILDWPYFIEGWGRTNCPLFLGFIEDFEDGVADNWIDDGSSTWSVADGVYKMIGNRPPGSTYTTRYSYYNGGVFDDFTFQIDVNNISGKLTSYRGMIFRGDGTLQNYYAFCVRSGSYYIYKLENGSHTNIRYWVTHNAVNTGYDVWNTLKVVCSGHTMDFYCNGTFLETITDAGGFLNGKAGVTCVDHNEYDYITHFDNAMLVVTTVGVIQSKR